MQKILLTAAMIAAVTACGGEGGDAANPEGADTTAAAAATDTAAPSVSANAAQAQLIDSTGKQVGTAQLTQTPQGVQIAVQVSGLPAGSHGIHIHDVGVCNAPDFASAGPHFNPTQKKHGLENAEGPHAGDLQNLEVGENGSGSATLLNERVTLGEGVNSLFGADGSALVIHAGPDDQKTDPSGGSGDRIACGVVAIG